MRENNPTYESVLKDLERHEVIIEMNDGLHRSILFKRPDSINKFFRLTTWKSHLCISGDMGCYVFSRIDDMFDFFGGEKINYGYWTEKLVATSRYGRQNSNSEATYEYFDVQATISRLKEAYEGHGEDLEDLEDLSEVETDSEMMIRLSQMSIGEPHEYLVYKPCYHILWCLYAIIIGIKKYEDATK